MIDINKTVANLGNLCRDLLPMHALSGCDTLYYPCGKGIIAALNVLQKASLNLEQMCIINTLIAELTLTFEGKEGNYLIFLRYTLYKWCVDLWSIVR